MIQMDVQKRSFRLGTLALLASMTSLFFNNAFFTLLGASGLSWFLAFIVLTICGLDIAATYVERSWWPYMFYLSALLFSPTAIGLSNADWLKWLGVSDGMRLFGSSLPDVFCFLIGALIVVGYLLSWGAERIGSVGSSLISEGAGSFEVNEVVNKAFTHYYSTVWALAIVMAVVWLISLALGGLLKASLSSAYALIALAAGIIFIALFYWSSINDGGDKEKSNGKQG